MSWCRRTPYLWGQRDRCHPYPGSAPPRTIPPVQAGFSPCWLAARGESPAAGRL